MSEVPELSDDPIAKDDASNDLEWSTRGPTGNRDALSPPDGFSMPKVQWSGDRWIAGHAP